MIRAGAIVLLLAATASAAAQQTEAPEARLERARAEAAAAEKSAAALDAAAGKARGEAERLALETRARAEALAAAEARLSESAIELEGLANQRQAIETRLAEERRPLAHLIAGLATLSRQPPLASLADASSTTELVRLQMLIDASVPAIERRTAALEGDLAELAALSERTRTSAAELDARRTTLAAERTKFAEAEARQRAAVTAIEAAAFGAARRGTAIREELAEIEDEATRTAKAAAEATALARYPAPPIEARRGRPVDGLPPFAYQLPSTAAVTSGLGSVSADGIRARGLTLAQRRGTALRAPADGVVRYAGALRTRDNVLAIDHGDGWISLLTGVASNLKPGDRVTRGTLIGRARGEVGVELWQDGRPRSPALIAGSSDGL